MRVLFDGFWWGDGPVSNRAVQRQLIVTWRELYPDDHLTVAVRRDVDSALPDGIDSVATRLWPHSISNLVELPRLARSIKADLTLAHNFAPWRGPSLLFIHDAMFVDHPEWFSRFEQLYFATMLPSARRATAVTTSSATEAARLERLSPKLRPVTPTGLDIPASLATVSARRPSDLDDIEQFALTVGRLNARKNLERTIEGAARSGHITPSSPLLVVGSSEHSGRSATLPEELDSLRADGRVRFLGFTDDAELAWLYAHAKLVLSLTRDEGFGLTPVEAAHFGAPLLVSDIDVHHETVGEYAAFVSPDAPPTAIGTAIDQAWGNRPSNVARDAVVDRWTWDGAVETMRSLAARYVLTE